VKILRLDLPAFGPFTDASLNLSPGTDGLHLIYGDNEAGKSSTLRALRQMFFGIPSKSADNFVHPYPKLRVGGLLRCRDGTELEFFRRKGIKNTLRAADDKTPLEDRALRAFLGGVDESQFSTMFGIDHHSLVSGGQEIVQGRGEVGHVLFAAGAGIADLRAVQARLEQDAGKLFSPRGKNPAINARVEALKQARRELRDAQLPSTEWQQHDAALREAEARLEEIQRELDQASRERTRLARLREAMPVIAKRRQAKEDLEALGDVPILRPEFAQQRFEAQHKRTEATQHEREALAEIEQVDQALAALPTSAEVLAQAEAIERIQDALTIHRKAQADLPGLEAKRDGQLAEARRLLGELRPGAGLDAAEQLRIPRRQRVEMQNLGARCEALRLELRKTRKDRDEAQRKREQIEAQRAALPEDRDGSLLKQALRRIRGLGDLEAQHIDAQADLQRRRRQAAIDLKKLGQWIGSLEELEALAVPAGETLDRHENQLDAAAQAVEKQAQEVDRLQAEAEQLEEQIRRVEKAGPVPTVGELADARQLRDAGWKLIRRTLQGESPDAGGEHSFRRHFDLALSLDAAFDQALHRADELADRLFQEATRVAEKAGLQAQLRQIQERRLGAETEQRHARENAEQVQQSWVELWQPLDIEPLSPREMRAWLSRQAALVEQAQANRNDEEACRRMAQTIEGHCEKLRELLADLGETSAAGATLAELLDRGDDVLEQIESDAETRRQLDRDARRLDDQHEAAEKDAQTAEAELAAWHERWAAALEPLGLSADTSPQAANAMLAQIDDLFEHLGEANGYAGRIDLIGRDAECFADLVRHTAAEVEASLVSLPPEEAAEAVIRQLRQAREDQQRRDKLEADRGRLDKQRQNARATIDRMTAQLDTLCREAGCEDVEALPEVERNSAEAVRLQQTLGQLDEQLAGLSAGASVESLIDEAGQIDADTLPERINQLDLRIGQWETERTDLLQRQGREQQALSTMNTGAAAAEKADEVQQILAEIGPDVQQYLALRLAAAVLRDGIERYRQKHEGPVLSRASELFRTLTLGSFESLRIDVDDRGENVLAGVRPGGTVAISPTAMSDGTTDQLYLALRIASLETWLDRHEPIPFVVDDILISFDDDRSRATLEVLGSLSRRTQVIFFSHHAHLVDLARDTLSDDLLFVHTLGQ